MVTTWITGVQARLMVWGSGQGWWQLCIWFSKYFDIFKKNDSKTSPFTVFPLRVWYAGYIVNVTSFSGLAWT